jgi:hypothetical protein
MTHTRPCRLMMRHFSHIFLVEGLTFMSHLQVSSGPGDAAERVICRVVAGVIPGAVPNPPALQRPGTPEL